MVPELDENVAGGGDVTRVLVKVGDIIAREQTVLELETDQAIIEVPSSVARRVTEIKAKLGDKVTVGAVVLIDEDGAAGAGELIAEGVLAVEMGDIAEDMKLAVHPHPALCETPIEGAEVFFGQSTHVYKPRHK